LAGIIRCPSSCSPRLQPERARRRRDFVLGAMLENRLIAPDVYRAALARVPVIKEQRGERMLEDRQSGKAVSSLYFIDAVPRQLTMRFGEGAVLRGGLRVYTTLDPVLQSAAEDAIAARLTEIDGQEKKLGKVQTDDNPVQGSLVAIDPRSGDVLALVG